MSVSLEQAQVQAEASSRPRKLRWTWYLTGFTSVLLIAAGFNLYQLSQNGWGNAYYAAAVKSMLQSWHNFFYVSYDPGGFVSVDKPPLGLWLQTISAFIFGYNGWALLLPQALAGVISVALVIHLTAKVFGKVAGLIAGLVMAVTPIAVAISRANNLDMLVVMFVLLATWAFMKALERGQLVWLLACVGFIGLGFNVKMLQAYLILPAFYLVYFISAPLSWVRRIGYLAIATVALIVVSFSWAVIVDLTPADQRPYVGSSQTNSVIDLIINYNGVGRVEGEQNGPGGANGFEIPANVDIPENIREQLQQGGNPAGAMDVGQPGLFRLFGKELGGQASWLLLLAFGSVIVLAWQKRWRWQLTQQQQSLVMWTVYLATCVIFFTVSAFFHRYYLVMLAPAIAVLVGAGIVTMWHDYRKGGWRSFALPLMFLISVAAQVVILNDYPGWRDWLVPITVAVAVIGALGLIAVRFLKMQDRRSLTIGLTGLGMVALLISPVAWSLTPVIAEGDSTLTYAGPSLLDSGNNMTRTFAAQKPSAKLLSYLNANRDGYKYLLAVGSSMQASSIIIETGQPVMAMGGFAGSDPILNATKVQALVKNKTVRFFQVGGFSPGGGSNSDSATTWVTSNCSKVDSSLYSDGSETNMMQPPNGMQLPPGFTPPTDNGQNGNNGQNPSSGNGGSQGFPGGFPGFGGGNTLYDCAGK